MAIPKRMGRDCELSTTGLTARGETVHSWRVTRHVLAHVGAAYESMGGAVWRRAARGRYRQGSRDREAAGGSESSDTLRRWASSGHCYYSDMAHVEVAGAETAKPRLLAAQCLAGLRACESARRRAEDETLDGTTYVLTTANVDIVDPDVSWGTHFNVSVEPELWEDLFRSPPRTERRGFVASAIAALIPFFGAGYVLPLRSGAVFSLSARAHHLTRFSTLTTTRAYGRGILNERREAHSESEDRLHLIGFDHALAGTSLLASTLQCALAAAELNLLGDELDDPVRATRAWSFGLDSRRGIPRGLARRKNGGAVSLTGFVRELVDHLLRLVADGSIPDEIAPGASELLPRVDSLARYVEEGSMTRAAPHLDWAAKLLVLSDACARGGLAFGDARIRVMDHDYVSSDPRRGHFWRLWEEERIDPLVTREEVDACLVDGPDDGRGWARGRLIRAFAEQITDVDWGCVELRDDSGRWPPRVRVDLPDTGTPNRDAFEPMLEAALRTGDLRRLEARRGTAAEASPTHASPEP